MLPEYIADGNWETLRRVITGIFRLLIDTGGRSIGVRTGSTDITVTAATNGAVTGVAHGLGKTPVTAEATGKSATGNVNGCVTALTATDMTVSFRYVDGTARTGTETVYWTVWG